VGMTKRQVQFILGAPLLTDPFHASRWDYIYLYEPGSHGKSKTVEQRVTLTFEDERVKSITGTMLPNPQPDTVPSNRQITVVVPPQERESVGVLTRLWRWMGFGDNS